MIATDGHILCTDSNPEFLGFFDPSIAPTLLFYAYIPIIFLSLLLGFFVLRSKSNLPLKNKLFFLLTLIFSLHIINEIIQWIAVPAGVIYFSWSISLLLRFLLLATTLYFAYVFVRNKDLNLLKKFILTLISLPIILFLPSKLNISGFDVDWCGAVDGPLWYYLYALQIIGIVFLLSWAIYKLMQFLKSKDTHHIQSFYVILSTGVFLGIFFGSETFGDLTEYFEFNLIGPIGMLIFLSAVSYIIVRYKAFNTKLIGAQALVIVLWALVGSLLFVAQSNTTKIVAAATLLFTTFAGYLLIKSVQNEVRQREELEKLTIALGKANERLKELDKLKSEFVSIASHQLRSPLTSIRGYASMLVEESFGKLPEKALEPLKRIEDSARHMAMSIEDYLNVSRIEAGNMKYNMADFNLRDEVEKVSDDVRPVAMEKGLVLLFRTDLKGQGVVKADIGKTVQIIHNLINNSMKYTPKGSITVLVHDNIQKKRIFVDIIDTGIGINQENLAKLFQKFSRADNANSVNVSGTGLGLFVALRMAEAMGGNITAHSDGDGKGSRFTLELPLLV